MRRLSSGMLIGLLMLTIMAGVAVADSNGTAGASNVINPGARIGEWISNNVTALFPPLLAVVALYYLMKRAFTQFLSFAVFAVVVSLFVYAPDSFKDAAVGLSKWVVGK